ncbi:MAG: zf-HC2 domain-containing protein [Anaerotignum sp.]|nr:zf-HC2 domain-containing protein [Anaerotignum sp.]
MSCEKCRELLWDYLENELTKEDADFVAAHFMQCESCQKEADQVKKIMDSLKNLPEEELPEGYHEEFMEKLAQEEKVSPLFVQKKPRYKWKQFSLVAAAVLLVAVIGGGQGILNLRENQNEMTEKMVNDKKEDTSDAAVEYSITSQGEGMLDLAPEFQQTEKAAPPDTGLVGQAKQNGISQEAVPQEEQKAAQNVQEELPKMTVSRKAEVDIDTDILQDEAAPELEQAETRSMLFAQNDSGEDSQAQQEVILTVVRKDGVLDSIRDLAVSLEGDEVEQALEDSIKVFVPFDHADDFMDGLRELGETRSMEEAFEETEIVFFEVTLETE